MFLLLLFSDRAASDAPFCPAFSKAGEMFPKGNAQKAALPPGKPRSFIARAACCPDRGKLSMQWKVPDRGRFYVLFASTKRTKSSRRAAALWTPRDGSKLYRLYFFVTFPALVPKPAYGATRFLRCFEPVRKGCCSTDARPIFFENGLLYYKLTGASRIRKGRLHVIFVAVELCI